MHFIEFIFRIIMWIHLFASNERVNYLNAPRQVLKIDDTNIAFFHLILSLSFTIIVITKVLPIFSNTFSLAVENNDGRLLFGSAAFIWVFCVLLIGVCIEGLLKKFNSDYRSYKEFMKRK